MEDPTEGLNSRRIWSRLIKVVATASLVMIVCAMTLNREFYEQIANNIFFSLTFASCCAVDLSVRPLREFLQAVALVVAFPFALMIQAACTLNLSALSVRSIAPLMTGLALILGWVALLRWGLPLVWLNRGIPWLLVIGTIGLTLALQGRLKRASGFRGHAAEDSVISARRQSTTTNMGR